MACQPLFFGGVHCNHVRLQLKLLDICQVLEVTLKLPTWRWWVLGVAGMSMTSLKSCFDGRGWHHHKVHMNEVSALMPEIIASKKLNGRTSSRYKWDQLLTAKRKVFRV